MRLLLVAVITLIVLAGCSRGLGFDDQTAISGVTPFGITPFPTAPPAYLTRIAHTQTAEAIGTKVRSTPTIACNDVITSGEAGACVAPDLPPTVTPWSR